MSITKKLLLALSVAILCQGSLQGQSRTGQADLPITNLVVGEPVEREIKGGEVQLYQVELRTGEFARGTVEQIGVTVNVRGFFPDGSKIRSFNGPAQGAKRFRFVAEAPGTYRLELKAAEGAPAGRYQIRLEQIQPMSERLKIVRDEQYQSPRLKVLSKELAEGRRGALDEFWREIERQGTPLAEPLEGDDRHVLVTFLWRAAFETYNVVVWWTPYSQEHPDDYQMKRLADTDLWYKTLRFPKGARFLYQLSPNDTLSRASNAQRYATAQADPLNARRQPADPNLTKYEAFSIAELPGAPPQPYVEPRPGVPAGKLDKQSFKSAILGNEREVIIYTPPGYAPGGDPYDLLVLFDGETYSEDIPAPTILDNLIAERKIKPLVAVLVSNASPDLRGRELSCNPQFTEFLGKELLPWVGEHYRVTRDPARATVGGVSLGGVAAACVALQRPEMFGNVLAQSGAFWWAPNFNEGEESNWLARQYAAAPARPGLKFFMEAGTFENDILKSSRHLRDVLRAKGYEVSYREFAGGHDRLTWRGSLADGLIELLGTRR